MRCRIGPPVAPRAYTFTDEDDTANLPPQVRRRLQDGKSCSHNLQRTRFKWKSRRRTGQRVHRPTKFAQRTTAGSTKRYKHQTSARQATMHGRDSGATQLTDSESRMRHRAAAGGLSPAADVASILQVCKPLPDARKRCLRLCTV